MSITKQEAQKFLEDFECGDILAISNLKLTNALVDHNDAILRLYLNALENLNSIMIEMEENVIPWDIEFNDLYRSSIELLYKKCEQILKEE